MSKGLKIQALLSEDAQNQFDKLNNSMEPKRKGRLAPSHSDVINYALETLAKLEKLGTDPYATAWVAE